MKKTASHDYSNALFTAGMAHNEKSIRRLAVLQYDLFQPYRKIVILLAGFAMILFGFFGGLNLQGASVSVFLGCLCLWFSKAPAQVTANRMVDAIRGKYPRTELYFREEEVAVTDGKEWFYMPYSMIQRVVQDKEYYYLWLTRATSYMIDKATVDPADLKAFQSFLEGKTGLLMEYPPSLLRFNLSAVVRRIKNVRAQKNRQG